MSEPVTPYETLVRWGVVHERLHRLADELADCGERAARVVERLSGRYDANGQPISACGRYYSDDGEPVPGGLRADPLVAVLADEFWEQFYRDVTRRLPHEDDDNV